MGPIINVALVRSLFSPKELIRWFGTVDLHDDDGTGVIGTLIPDEAAMEIARRLYGHVEIVDV